jgi:hypothetical protein
MRRPVNPLRGKTTNWLAVCGKSACTVRREGGLKPISSPYPYMDHRPLRGEPNALLMVKPATYSQHIPYLLDPGR